MKQKVFWTNSHYKKRKSLKGNIECDYLIAGGGITGVMATYFLLDAGEKNIVLIEKDQVGSGATGKAAGIYTPIPEQWYMDHYIRYMGMEKSARYWVAHLAAFHTLKDIIENDKIDCDFEYAPLFCLESPHAAIHEVFKEYKFYNWMHTKIKLMMKKDIDKEVHASLFARGFKLWKNMSVNPLKLVQKLSNVIEMRGARIYESSPMISQKGNIVKTPMGSIKFNKSLIECIDSWTQRANIEAIKTTIAVTKPLSMRSIRLIGQNKKMMFWDVKKRSYHYGKFLNDRRMLVGYGDKTIANKKDSGKVEQSHLAEINKFIGRLLPGEKPAIEYAWSGIYGNNNGLLPFVEIKDKKTVIAGSGSQVTSVMLAQYAARKLTGKKHTLDAIFSNLGRPCISLAHKPGL